MSLPKKFMVADVSILSLEEMVEYPDDLASQAGFVGLDPWMRFVHRVYGFPIYRLIAGSRDAVSGLLSLVHVKHPIFGNYLATAPFASYGGFAFSSTEARDALLARARELGRGLDAEYVNVRFDAPDSVPPNGWIQRPLYATYRADLGPDPEALLAHYSSDHRNHVRKSLKKGFSVRFGHLNLLDETYRGLSASMHELGSPYHSKGYLRAMAESLGADLEFVVIYDPRGRLAGAGVFVFQGQVATNIHANILRRFRADYAGEFLYWSVIGRYCLKGCKVLDLGRSLIGSGNETFKMKWRPRKELLCYWYDLNGNAQVPALNQKNPKFRLAIRAWQLLPAPVVQWLGPSLIRGLV